MNDKRDPKDDIGTMMQRYLSGETTPEEERRLAEMIGRKPDATAEEKALAAMMRPLAHSEEEIEQWLAEDETELYDEIVRQRQRRAGIRGWAAAASVALLTGVALWLGMGSGETPGAPLAQETAAPDSSAGGTVTAQAGHTAMAERHQKAMERTAIGTGRSRHDAAEATEGGQEKPRTAAKKADDMTPVEQIQDLIAGIEAQLETVGDSVYTAHVERMIESDRRLNRLVDKMMASGTQQEQAYPPTSGRGDYISHNF